jgi:excisionase family DNA binding protein
MTSRAQGPHIGRDLDQIHVDRLGRRRARGLQRYHSVDAVAEVAGASKRTVQRWIARGDLVAHRVGRVVRIAEDDWQAFWDRHRRR